MKQKLLLRSLLLLFALIAGSTSLWADTKTEGFEKKTASTTYNSTVAISTSESDCGIAWSIYFGTVSTNDKISGNNSAQMRWYSGTNVDKIPYAKTTTAIEGLSNVALKARTSNLNVKMDVCYSEDGDNWTVGKTHTFTATGTGENVSLAIPSGNQYVKFAVSSSSTAPSSGNYKLIVDDVVFTYTSSGTPTCAAPTFSPAGNAYIDAQNVTIACETEGATIYYTTNGDDPTTSSSVYSAPIAVSANTTIKALAAKDGYNNSSIATAEYSFPATTYNTIAELIAAAPTEPVILNLTNAQVLGVGSNDMYVKDATGALDLYKLGLTYTAGQILNGKVAVEATTTYNGMFEITAIGQNKLVATAGTLPTPTVLANASDATLADYGWKFVTVTGDATATNEVDGLLMYKALMNYSNFMPGVDNLTATGLLIPFQKNNAGDVLPELLPTSIICHITLSKDMVTYCSNNKLDFTGTGLKVYSAKVEEGVAKLTEIENAKVTNGKGIILAGTAGQPYDVPFNTAGSTSISNNDLVGVVAETAVAYNVDTKYNYILQNGAFYKATGAKLKAGKAYLSTTYDVTAAGAPGLSIVIAGEATGIKTVENVKNDDAVYDLSGRRVAQPTKGLYIMNGRKILVK